MASRKKVAVLISGRGSNLKALIEACQETDFPAEICIVLSNRPDAPGLDYAKAASIPSLVIDHTDYDDREDFDQRLNDEIEKSGADIICNAGFMRLLTEKFVERWKDRQLNIHPSLLPSFKGMNVHERVLDSGSRISGCTVHFVRMEMDTGPIIAQAAVPVLLDDTADKLADRVLAAEHKLYPLALRLVASGAVRVVAERVVSSGHRVRDGAADDYLLSPLMMDQG